MLELTPQQQQFVDSQVERDREYLQLQSAIAQVQRGEYEPLDIEDVKRRGRERACKLC